jgi:hypothetical protein
MGLVSALVAVFIWWLCPLAAAQSVTHGDPSVDQYVESLPTASGPQSDRANPSGDRAGPIPPNLRDALRDEDAETARDLAAIATAPELGAPDARPDRERRSSRGDAKSGGVARAPGTDGADGSGAGVSAAAKASVRLDRTPLALIAALLGITVIVVLARLRRRDTTPPG